MKWTNEKPTQPGAYWLRGWSSPETDRAALVEVQRKAGISLLIQGKGAGLICNLHERNSGENRRNWYPVGDLANSLEWCGPLVPAEIKPQHPDDEAVDAFTVAMKAKLAEARAKGRGGWQGDEPGMQQHLSGMLRDHVNKGDPVDVANFSMMLHQRGEKIQTRHESPKAANEVQGDQGTWDRFAAAALTGEISRVEDIPYTECASHAAGQADALMAERAKRMTSPEK